MSEKALRVSQLARLTGVTVRTLHHYDAVGLLMPSRRTAAGYREYTADDVLRLQEILIARQQGMPLAQIKLMLDDPDRDRRAALLEQRQRLQEQASRTEAMLRSIDAALLALERQNTMDQIKEIFDFDFQAHEEETQARWGQTEAYAESKKRTSRYTADDWRRIKSESDDLMARMVAAMHEGVPADDERALALAEEHRRQIDRWYYPCSHAAHLGLAEMYLSDDRFRSNIDQHGEGLTDYLAVAIRANHQRQ